MGIDEKLGLQDYYTVDIAVAETVDNRKHILGNVYYPTLRLSTL